MTGLDGNVSYEKTSCTLQFRGRDPDPEECNAALIPAQGKTVIHPKVLAKRRKASKAARKARKNK